MLDIGWSELLVIVVVLVVVVGPKELPGVLRTFGGWMAKARSLSREFQNNMNQLAREVEKEKVKVATPPPTSTAAESDPTGASPTAAGDKATPEPAAAEPASETAVVESTGAASEDETKAAAESDGEGAPAAASEGATWAAPGPPPNPGILTSTPPADLSAAAGAAGKSNGSGRAEETAADDPVLAATPSSAGER